jgi:M6 family metalloprotease-like protein
MSAIFGEVLTFGQPGANEISLRVFGDEHYARYETLAGYSVVFDRERGKYCYARLSAGRFQSTGVGADESPPATLVRHLQEDRKVVAAKAGSRRLARASIARSPRAREVNRTHGPNQGLLEGRVLSTGSIKGLTILVNFQDVKSTTTRADVEEMLNGTNYTKNGNICSAREYFKQVSSGKLDYTNVVVGPYTLSRNRQYYVDNLLIEEALQLAVDDGLDLTQFDSRKEGLVDALNVLYAGQTQYAGELWPHNYSIDLKFGSLRTDMYLLTSLGRTPADLSIGTFCHENGHLLCRFPDMYDYGERDGDSKESAGIGYYCLMGAGNHLDYGRSPAPVSAYLRDLVGWCDNEVDLSKPGAYKLKHGDYNTVFKYRTSKPNECFIVENRTRMGLDRAGTSSGVAVYHCDIEGSNEYQGGTAARHYQCALLQADGHRDLELNNNQGDGADLFDATAGVALSSATNPNSREWDGRDSGLTISSVGAPGPVIAFTAGAVRAAATKSGRAEPDLSIPDNKTAGVASAIAIDGGDTVSRIVANVDVRHPRIGDLRVVLTSPTGKRAVLHGRIGGGKDNLIETYDSASPGVLTNMIGQPVAGTWTLVVSDRAARNEGRLKSWSLELHSN